MAERFTTNLNQRIGEALRERFQAAGLEGCPKPCVLWLVGNKAEHWSRLSGDEWECREWLERKQRENPEYVAGLEVYSLDKWPDFCGDGNAMLLLIEAMRRLGWSMGTVTVWPGDCEVYAQHGDGPRTLLRAESLPLAVARAAAKALGVGE